MTAFPKYASGLSQTQSNQNPMRMSQNPTATATFQNVTGQTDNAQLRSKKTPPDLNYTAGSKSLQINKERLFNSQENPGSTNRLHRRVPRPRLCFRTTRFSPITPNHKDSPIWQGGCAADPEPEATHSYTHRPIRPLSHLDRAARSGLKRSFCQDLRGAGRLPLGQNLIFRVFDDCCTAP